MTKKNITMLMAHPDDEFLFGFPVIHEAKKIIACVSDVNNPQRQWCKRRKEAFFEICAMVGAEGICLDYSSRFYTLEWKHGNLSKFIEEIRDLVKDEETIFTHNDWGEYGHLDHTLLNTVSKMTNKRIITTDICMQADWYNVERFKQGEPIGYFENDLDFHNKCADIYRKYGAFGWSYQPVKSANLIEVIR